MIAGLLVILIFVTILPFAFHRIEKNLEVFLFSMGILSAIIGGALTREAIRSALVHPIGITAAVLTMGLVFRLLRGPIEKFTSAALARVNIRLFIFLLILGLGIFSSAITAIIAALVLVEVICLLKLARRDEIRIVIVACYAIGMGAVLTPLGEPLSTIAIAKLSGAPHHADFWFLFRLLAAWVMPGVVALSLLSLLLHERRATRPEDTLSEPPEEVSYDESYKAVFVRAFKVYLFVMALVFLGEGFKPLVDRFVIRLPALALYWINMSSAILDNATLAAAEISPLMSTEQIRDLMISLLISGGMLIPGNIPNIVAATRLKISMKEWARFGVPVGLAGMLIYFLIIIIVSGGGH